MLRRSTLCWRGFRNSCVIVIDLSSCLGTFQTLSMFCTTRGTFLKDRGGCWIAIYSLVPYNCIWQSLQPSVKERCFLQEWFSLKLQLQCCLAVGAPAFPCQMAETGGRSDSLWWQDTELCCVSMHLCDTAKILRRRYNLHAHLVIITFQTLVTQ